MMQARGIHEKPESSLIKRLTPMDSSLWQKTTQELLTKYNIDKELIEGKKEPLKRRLNFNIENLIKRKIEAEAREKTKTKHWAELKEAILPNKRPDYMNKLNRKQCNAILKTRSSMLPVKMNQRSQFTTDSNQQHILQECNKVPGNDNHKLTYTEFFKDEEYKELGKAADRVIEIIAILEDNKIDR